MMDIADLADEGGLSPADKAEVEALRQAIKDAFDAYCVKLRSKAVAAGASLDAGGNKTDP
jgi:hypothetical protein